MFKLNLDVRLYFDPPMVDHGKGVTVTRELDLPFAPTEGLFLGGVVLNGVATPLGYKINEVTWDIDRGVFFANSSSSFTGFPIACIPLEIRSWIDRGWRLGTYEDTYEKEDKRVTRFQRKPIACKWNWEDEDEAEKWPSMRPRSRPENFNQLLKAVVREMALLDNNSAVAYAMYRTHMFFDETELEKNETPAAKKFKEAKAEFDRMDFGQQYDWRQSIARRCPHLEQFLGGSRRKA
jgi:hypothetical protein